MKVAFWLGLIMSWTTAVATPAWPAGWEAAAVHWDASTGSWRVAELAVAHGLLPGATLGLTAQSAVLRPGADGAWDHIHLTGANWTWTDRPAPIEALRVRALRIETATHELRLHGYTQGVDAIGFDSLFFVPLQEEDRYAFRTDRVRVLGKRERIEIEGFAMIPQLSARNFPRGLDERSTRMSLDVRRLEVNGADVSDMLRKKSFVADSTVIDGVYFTVDTYMYLPKRQGGQRLPHQLLAAVAPELKLGVIEVTNSRIEVQFNHERRRSGFLSFGDLRATVRNLSNSRYEVPLDLRIDVRTLLYDQGLTDISFRMPCGTEDGRFWINGRLGAMDFRAVNEVLITEGNFRVRRGQVDSLIFNIEANDTLATGKAYPYYRNLKARKLRGFKSNQPRKFFSSIMDLLGIPDDNPEGGKLIVGNVLYPRNPQQSFFAYCWNALRTGILSVMTPNYLLPDKQESEKIKNY